MSSPFGPLGCDKFSYQAAIPDAPDVCRAERKRTARPEGSTELVLPREEDEDGCRSVANELFYMRLGRMKLSRRWDERSVSARLTALVVMGIASVGFAGGLLVGRVLEEWGKSRRCDLYL